MGVVRFDEALQIVLEKAATLPAPGFEQVALLDALGRTLAEPVRADRDQPPFDRSTRDGFAVSAAHFVAGKTMRIAGEVRAGQRWSGPALAPGEAIRIMTGAPIPLGADAVAMVEFVEIQGDSLCGIVGRGLAPGENIVPRGCEARRGDTVIPPGTRFGAADIALAAACGCSSLTVFQKPRVAIAATGDELIELGGEATPREAEIWNSNSYALAALVAQTGAHPERLAVVRDVLEDLQAAIAVGRKADLLILSGGVSMGDYDLVEAALADAGAEFFFTGVKMQPGKPVVFGHLPERDGAKPCFFFGLPGNPISTQVTFQCFVAPMLRALAGSEPSGPPFVQATLAEPVSGKPGLTRLLPARLTHRQERPEVRLVGWQGSGDVAANARANCYAVLPAHREAFAPGDVVSILLR